ncbi:MAG TPA: hypothetical protein VHP35_09730, partial [Terriglobia bacterium]|nr:hypothetical protein [Terriglobia bacterium]
MAEKLYITPGALDRLSFLASFTHFIPHYLSYLPLLSFGPSTIVPGSAYLLTPPFGYWSAS